MKTYGVIFADGRKELISIVLDDDGNPRMDTLAPYPKPENWVDPTIVPLVKIDKPGDGYWTEYLVWKKDRVERQWVPANPPAVPPEIPVTAEEHLNLQGYTPLRLLTLLDIEGKLHALGQTSDSLAAVRSWIDTLTISAAINPNATRDDWPDAPFPFEVVLIEALSVLPN